MAGTRGSRSNYSDKPNADTGALPEHRLRFDAEQRAYSPSDGESDEIYGSLGRLALGDESFKSARFYKPDAGYTFDASEIAQMYPDGYTPGVNPACTSERYKAHQAKLEAQMPTFKGVPPSAAELYRGSMHQPG